MLMPVSFDQRSHGEKTMIKVIGGEFSGRTLSSVPGRSTRPPLARVRAAVANILQNYIPGAKILDLFAGTGSYSIELLSRGATFATMIDKDRRAVTVMKTNVKNLSLFHRVEIIHGDALKIMPLLERKKIKYRIILAAPPYFTMLDQRSMEFLGTRTLLEPGGIVLLQQHKKESHLERYGKIVLQRSYRYGDTYLSTYS